MSPVLAKDIYEKLPKWFGFKPAEDLEGYLKLEKAKKNYRKLIGARLT